MKRCESCQSETSDEVAKFCRLCGGPLVDATPRSDATVPVAPVTDDSTERVPCPSCKSLVKGGRKTCPACGHDLTGPPPVVARPSATRHLMYGLVIVLCVIPAGLLMFIGDVPATSNSHGQRPAAAANPPELSAAQRRANEKCEDRHLAFIMSQSFVERRLRSPKSAEFPRFSDSEVRVNYVGDCTFEVRAYVDAQNAFGALLRTNYFVKLRNQKGTDEWIASDVQLLER